MAVRPTTLTTKQLAAAVGSAVKSVAEKHKVVFEKDLVIGPGTICGPYLRAAAGMSVQTAHDIAGEIAAHVTAAQAAHAGAHADAAHPTALRLPGITPGFSMVNDILICGFWPGPVPIVDFGPAIF